VAVLKVLLLQLIPTKMVLLIKANSATSLVSISFNPMILKQFSLEFLGGGAGGLGGSSSFQSSSYSESSY
jgi:hypothetical protein